MLTIFSSHYSGQKVGTGLAAMTRSEINSSSDDESERRADTSSPLSNLCLADLGASIGPRSPRRGINFDWRRCSSASGSKQMHMLRLRADRFRAVVVQSTDLTVPRNCGGAGMCYRR